MTQTTLTLNISDDETALAETLVGRTNRQPIAFDGQKFAPETLLITGYDPATKTLTYLRDPDDDYNDDDVVPLAERQLALIGAKILG